MNPVNEHDLVHLIDHGERKARPPTGAGIAAEMTAHPQALPRAPPSNQC